MCTTVAGNNSSSGSGSGAGSYTNGPIQPGSSPAGLMLMSSNATTPSPRAPSASSSPGLYSHHPNAGGHGHTPTASPSPQHVSSHVQPNRTPPSSYGHSPLSHLNNHDNNNGNSGCFDVVNRLKNRMDLYRGHHENALAKEHVYIDQCNQKIKAETNRLVKKQTVANEANSAPSNNRKKNNSSMGSTGTGGAGGGRARANANKRSAACLLADSNSPNTMTPAGAMTSVCANSPASSSPTPAGPASKAKVPRMTAKQRKLLKQQQLDGTMVAPNSQLMMNCSMSGHHQQQHQNLNSNNHQTTSTNTTNQDLLNGSSPSVYKFDPHSPQDQKPSVNFLSNNSGLSSSYMQQQHNYHQPQQLVTIKQENFQSSCSSSYLGQLDANSLHDLLGNSGQAQHSSMSLNHQQNSSLPDDDSKDLIINQILELDPDDNINMMSITPGSNGQNGMLSNDHSNSIFGTSADESLSNRFGDEDFIKKMLEDLNNGFETTSNGSCNSSNGSNSIHHFHHQSSSSSSVQMVESFRFNDSTSGNSPVMNGNGSDSMMNHLSSQQPRNHNQLEQQNSFNSFSNPSTPMMMNAGSSSGSTGSSPMNHYGGASNQTPQQQQQLPNFNQLRQTQPNASLPSFNTLAANGNGQHSLSGQSPRLNAQLTNSNTNQVPNHGGNNCNVNPLLAAQQPLSNHSMTPTPPGSSSPINSHAHQMMCKSPYGRPNSAGPPGNNAGQQTTPSNLLLHPVINQASPDPVRTPPLSNQAKMMTSPMMCHGQRVNNTPSPVSSPHQNVSMMCPRASSSTPPTPGASGVVNNSGPNASVALKQMAQQQQNKWNQGASSTAANSNDFYNQQSQMMMRQSPGQPQQRLMMQQQQPQSYTQSQQILSSQLQNSNPNQMMQQYHRPNTIIPGNGVQQQQQRAQMAYGTSQQQPRPAVANNNANANFYQRCATGNNLAPQQQQIVRNQNIRAQRMMQQQTRIQQQQQQQQQQHRFSHGQSIRPQTSFNPQQSSQQQQQQMSSFASRQSASMINVSPQTQPIMSTQRFVNNANNNHWASSQSMQQQQQQTMMAPSQQQHQQQQYSMPNYGPPHGAGAPITNSGDSSNSNTGGYF